MPPYHPPSGFPQFPFFLDQDGDIATQDKPHVADNEQWVVIYVEDSIDDAMFAKRIMMHSPYIDQVITLPDGQALFHFLEDLQAAKGTVPDRHFMIILDILLPGQDGLFLLQALKGSPLTESMPVMIMSGVQDLNMVYDSYTAHANGYLHKPFRPEYLNDLHAVMVKGSSWKTGSDTGHA